MENVDTNKKFFLPDETIAFFRRRDERSKIILERLKFCGASFFDGKKYLFVENNKRYKTYTGNEIESYEFFPKVGELREILGIPFKLSGIDYSYPFFKRRVIWSHWSGALTDKQRKLVLDIISNPKR